jgi:hypothetical protein
MLHTIAFFHHSNKDRIKGKDHESNELDRAMHCSNRKQFQKRQLCQHAAEVQNPLSIQPSDILGPSVRSHTSVLVLICVFSLRRLVEALTSATGALRTTVRVGAGLATAHTDM